MSKANPDRDEHIPLRPVGLALAAVVAGLGAGKAQGVETRAHAPLAPTTQEKTFLLDHTNHPGFEEDAGLVIGRSDPVSPFGGA